MKVIYRKATIDDADNLLIFLQKLDQEAEFILYDPGERNYTQMQLQACLKKLTVSRSIILIAEDEQHVIQGYIVGEVQNFQRKSHVMQINIGVLKAYHHTRIAYRLTGLMKDYASEIGVNRGEATVIESNLASLSLCQKIGFEIEGIKRRSIKISDKFYDEICFGYLL